jgi:CO/xanthine dehydrogenase FAD-binding subunit
LARDFFTGKGESPFNLGPDEILTSIRIPIPWSETSSSYQRLAYRSAVDFPMVNSACVAIIENNKVESFKMAVSALGPAPVALTELEKVVRGNEPDPEMASMAEEVAGRIAESTVVENSVSPKDYRIGAASVMAGRAVRAALKLPDKNS